MKAFHVYLTVVVLVVLASVDGLWATDLKIATIDVAPFGMLGPDGKPTGMMFEIGNKIAETAGLSATNTLVPYARSAIDVAEGRADFVLRFSNPELQSSALPLATIVTVPTVIVSKKEQHFTSLESLHGKTVGMLRGGVFDERFAKDDLIKKHEANDYNLILKMLMGDRFEAAIGSNLGLYYEANRLGLAPSTLSPPLVLSTQDFVLHFSKKSPMVGARSALVRAAEKLRQDGTFDKIINKYMGSYNWNVVKKN